MVTFNINSNERRIIANARLIENRVMPTVLRNSINDTLFDVRKHTVDVTYPKAFNVKNKRFIAATLRVEKSTKVRLKGSVFDRLGRDYLQRHTTGGIKRPRGRNLAIPAQIKRTKSGQISKANRPRQILNKPRVFKVKSRSGQEMIMRRRTKKGKTVEVLYLLEQRARIRKTFRFYDGAIATTKRNFPRHFAREFRINIAKIRKG